MNFSAGFLGGINNMIDDFFGKFTKKNKGKNYCYGPTEAEECHCDYCMCGTSFGREGHHHHHPQQQTQVYVY